MYFIIGGDGKEYGPISEADLRQWVAGGRLNHKSQAKAESDAEFRPLANFPEFADLFGAAPTQASAPPPIKTSGMAITSLVLGILGFLTCGLTSLFGLIFGIIALVKINNNKGTLKGFGLALTGTILSGVFLLLVPIWAALLLPALAGAKQRAQAINCESNEKQLALAIRIYAGDNNDHFPPAATWCDAIKEDAGNERVFKCPAADPASRCDYGYNSALDGMDDSKVDPQTVMLFESDGGWNANGGADSMITASRHEKKFVVAFADGSVEEVPESGLSNLRWSP